ncbi:hypothetical protein [Lysobacter capsici]|uniref:hypothetical protein n=1 Tax=Lysobacter capsici TaxID=435897 RepID=UPI0007166965|nr:hypothetical protein [Lysobacter capsici]
MLIYFAVLTALATLLILPGWLWLQRARPRSAWVLVLPQFGINLWLAIAAAGIGAQSLSNLIELFGVAAVGVAIAYFKFLVLDRSSALSSRATAIAFGLIALAAIGLRLLMPILPE